MILKKKKKFCNAIIIVQIILILPFAITLNNQCKNSNGLIGICIEEDNCIARDGHYEHNRCPNDGKSIKCCDSIPCEIDNIKGQCRFKPVFVDNKYSEFKGFCPGENNFLCFIERSKVIYLNAKANIRSNAWAIGRERQAKKNNKVVFTWREPKCNLFVYEILRASDIDIGTPNRAGWSHPILKYQGKDLRPPCTQDWFNNKVKYFKPLDDPTNAEIGDIITNGKHVGIVSGFNTTISASARYEDEYKVVNNNWGYRGDEGTIKIFRYDPTYEPSIAQKRFDQETTLESDSDSCYNNNEVDIIQLCKEHPEYCEEVVDVPNDDIITIDDLLINIQDNVGTLLDDNNLKASGFESIKYSSFKYAVIAIMLILTW